MLKIGDFSKLSRISIRMLRHYDEMGLLVPDKIDPFTGYRYYSESRLPTAGRINALKDMGFSLAAIGEILKNYDDSKALYQFLTVKRQEIEEEQVQLNNRLLLLETAMKRLGEDSKMMEYNVILKTMPERYVASVRQIIPAYDQEGVLWGILHRETISMNLQAEEPCCGLAIYHDEGFKEKDVDIEIQMSVKGEYENTEEVVFKTVPSVKIASATYKGSYDRITLANEAVARWACDNGYEFDGPMFCIYHVGPAQTSNPEEMVTEVCYPIKKK